jgi:hypothetical protein
VSEDVAPPRPGRDGIQRLLNGLALLLLLGGVAIYLYALWRMEGIARGETIQAAGGGLGASNVARWHELGQLSNVGLGMAATGVVAALAAALRHFLRNRRRIDEQADRS